MPDSVLNDVVIRIAEGNADLAAWAGIRNQTIEFDRVTVEELEHDIANDPSLLMLLATIGDRLAGCGIGRLSRCLPDALFAMARVAPEMRRRGAGTALYVALSDHARHHALSHLFGRLPEVDTDSLAWVVRRGFEAVARESTLVLDLADVSDSIALAWPDGVELVSFSDRPDLAEAAHQIETEAILDMPGPAPQVPLDFEAWTEQNTALPGFAAEGSFVALLHGDPVGYAGLTLKEGLVAEHLLTGVLRIARGRGSRRR